MINVQPNGPWKMIEELAKETDLTEEPWEMDCGRRVILPEADHSLYFSVLGAPRVMSVSSPFPFLIVANFGRR